MDFGRISGAFGKDFGRIPGAFGKDFVWHLACGLLVVCLFFASGLFWVCLWFAACGSFLCSLPCVPSCPLLFPCVRVFPAFPFFARFPFPCQGRTIWGAFWYSCFCFAVDLQCAPPALFGSGLPLQVEVLGPISEALGPSAEKHLWHLEVHANLAK